MRAWAERAFEEIKKVVWSIEDDKASGPYGFSTGFFLNVVGMW